MRVKEQSKMTSKLWIVELDSGGICWDREHRKTNLKCGDRDKFKYGCVAYEMIDKYPSENVQ